MKKPTAKSVEEVNIYLEGLGLGTADNGNLTRDGNLSVERTGGGAEYQFALDSNVENPGEREDVITDQMILSAVQATVLSQ